MRILEGQEAARRARLAVLLVGAASYGFLIWLLVSRYSVYAAVLIGAVIVGATGCLVRRWKLFSKSTHWDAALILDRGLATSDRALSYVHLDKERGGGGDAPSLDYAGEKIDLRALMGRPEAASDTQDPRLDLIEKQLERLVVPDKVERLLPERVPRPLRRFAYTLPLTWACCALLLYLFSSVLSPLQTHAARLRKLAESEKTLPPELADKLMQLAETLEQPSPDTAKLEQQLGEAERQLDRSMTLEGSSATVESRGAERAKSPETKSPPPAPTPTPKNPEQSSEQQKDEERSQSKSDQQKSGGQGDQKEDEKQQSQDGGKAEEGKEGEGQKDQKGGGQGEGKEKSESEGGGGKGEKQEQSKSEKQSGGESGEGDGNKPQSGSQGKQQKGEKGGQGGQQGESGSALNEAQQALQDLRKEMQQQKGQQSGSQGQQQGQEQKQQEESQSQQGQSDSQQRSGQKESEQKSQHGSQSSGSEKDQEKGSSKDGKGEERPTEKRDAEQQAAVGSEEAKEDGEDKGEKQGAARKGSLPTAQEAKPSAGGMGENESWLGGEKGFKEFEVKSEEEKVSDGETSGPGERALNTGEARPKTTLEDLELARPEAGEAREEQPIPLEYRELLR